MINRIILTLALIIVTNVTYGQDIKLQFYAAHEHRTKESNLSQSIVNKDKLVCINFNKDDELEISIRRKKDLKVLKRRMVIGGRKSTNQTLSDNFNFQDLIRLKDRIYLLVNSFEKSKKEKVLLAQEIDENSDFIGNLMVIDKIKIDHKSKHGGFNTIISKDSTKLLIVNNPPFLKNKQEQFIFKTLNSDLKSISNVKIELPYKDNDFIAGKKILTNDGNIVLSGYYIMNKRATQKHHENEKMVIYIIEPSGKYKDFEISVPKRELTSVNIDISKDNNTLFLSGLIRNLEINKKDEYQGIVTVKIDIKNKTIIARKNSPFSKNIIAKARDEKEKNVRSKDGIPSNFYVNQFLINKDGTSWTLLERGYYITNKYGTTYHFMGIVAILIDSEGEIAKEIYIPKNQVMCEKNEEQGSFCTFHNGKRLFLVLNDHEKNISLKSKTDKNCKILSNATRSNLFAFELMKDGSYKKIVLYNNEEKICLVKYKMKISDFDILLDVHEFSILGVLRKKSIGLARIIIE